MTKKRRWPIRYGFALLAFAGAISLAFAPVLSPAGGSLLIMAVLLSAWFGGMGPGLFSVVLIVLLFLVDQGHRISRASPVDPRDFVNLGLFVTFGVMISHLIGALHATRQRAEDSRGWLSAVLTGISDAVIATDAQGRVAFTNPVAQALTGWDKEEAVGEPLEHVFHIVSEETREPVEQPVARVLRDGVVVGLANHTLLIARDGTPRPIADGAAPIRDELGNIWGVVLVFRDVAEMRRTAELKERLAAVVESSDDIIISESLDGVITSWNRGAERILGYAAEETVGRHISMLMTPEQFEDTERILGRVRRGENVDHFETKRRRKDGAVIDVSLTVSPIRNDVGKVIGASKIGRDITRKRLIEAERLDAIRQSEAESRRLNADLECRVAQRTAQLEAANEELEAFSYSVAHDLRSPLRAIEGFSQILLDKYADRLDDLGKDYLHRVGAAAKRLEQLIGDLLNLSRLTRSEMRHSPVDLSAIALAVAADLKEREPHRQVEFVIARGAVACGDARLLRFAIENLLGNAWKYTGMCERARIEFGEAVVDGQTTFFVRDDGAGFDMAYVEKLFRPFQRLHNAREFPGTGIGLASVKRLVGRHGGRVWAEGAVGRGATFYFTLDTRLVSHLDSEGATNGREIHAFGGR
jgi:PAS domain S-box-containing protein